VPASAGAAFEHYLGVLLPHVTNECALAYWTLLRLMRLMVDKAYFYGQNGRIDRRGETFFCFLNESTIMLETIYQTVS
jgi:hypothetical protein